MQCSTEGYEMRIEIAKICRYEIFRVIDNLIGIVRGEQFLPILDKF